ncbi:MAG: alpha/beta hydrolase [Cellulosilyticaceae bacterium]
MNDMRKIIIKGLKIIGKSALVVTSVIGIALISLFVWNQIKCIQANKQLQAIGKEVQVGDKKLRVYEIGQGDKTIVMLSGLGTYSPIMDYKPLADRLGESYKVVVLEYSGYGLSKDTKEPRTAKNIVEEIRGALQMLDIQPPYILMPHSISGIYSMQYVKMYPHEVEGIVGIDMSMANQVKYGKQRHISQGLRIVARTLDLIGITRIHFQQEKGYFTDMAAGGYYTEPEIKLAKEIGARNTASRAIVDENNRFVNNCEPLYDLKYPKDLPVLAFLSTSSAKEFDTYMNQLGEKVTWQGLHEEAIVAPNLQQIQVLEGGHYLHWMQTKQIAQEAKVFIETIKK